MMKFYIDYPDYNYDDAGFIKAVDHEDYGTTFTQAKKDLDDSLNCIMDHCRRKRADLRKLKKSDLPNVGDIGPC